jgi:hypothetical protein
MGTRVSSEERDHVDWWLKAESAGSVAERGGFAYLRRWLAELEQIELDGFEPFDPERPHIASRDDDPHSRHL